MKKPCAHTHANYDTLWRGERVTIMGCYAIVRDVPGFGYGEDRVIFSARCIDCGEMLSLGHSYEAPEAVQVEILAAEVGQSPDVWRRFMDLDLSIEEDLHRLGACGTLSLGALSPDAGHLDLNPPPPWTVSEHHDYLSGWLALEIATHDERDQRDADTWPWDPTRPIAEQDEPWMRPNEQDMRAACERAGLIAERCDGCDGRCPVGTCERMREAIEDHDSAPCEACDTADGCEEHQMFTCSDCGKLVPWADGADDDGPDVCSACWCAANGVTASSDRDDLVEVDLIVGEEPEHGVEAEVSVGPTNESASTESPGDAFMRRTASMVQLTADDMRTRIGRKP